MISSAEFVVAHAEAGIRLDRLLAERFPTTRRATILTAISGQRVTVNGRPAAKGAKVAAGDRVTVAGLLEATDHHARPDPALPLHILYEDATVLAIAKSAGMPVHPLRPEETGTVVNALLAHAPPLADIGDDPLFPAIVHRLDTDTSGVLLAACSPEAYARLRADFRDHRITKAYSALVRGSPSEEGLLEHLLAHDPSRPGRMLAFATPPARPELRLMRARTRFRVTTRYTGYTLLAVQIETGVTHQIRAQLAAAGYPIAADRLYGGPAARGELGLQRHFLHAAALTFRHPLTGGSLHIEAPLPDDLAQALATLAR